MSEYVESGYVEKGYIEGDTSSPETVTCDLTLVNTKLDLILTKLSSMSNSIVSLDARLAIIGARIDNLDNICDDNTVSLSAINAITSDIRTTVNNELVSIQNIKDIVPMVTDMSLRVYPNGTKVKVIGVHSGVCTVMSSTLIPDTDYTYLVQYTLKLDGTDRISNFLAPQVTNDLNADT